MRKIFLLKFTLASIAYTAGWYYLADKLQKNLETQLIELRSQGYEIAYKDMKVEDIRVNKDIPISATKIRNDVEKNKEYLENNQLLDKMKDATQIIWATGGNLVPEDIREEYLRTHL